MIRFSESVPGAFAVAYVTTDRDERIKHFLVYALNVICFIFILTIILF